MKTVTLAALALMGASITATPASAAPFNPGMTSITPDELSNVVQVGGRGREGKRFRGHDDHDFGFRGGFWAFPLALGLGYGLGSRYYYENDRPQCDGRWHRHRYNKWHCHGDLYY
jgi:hypothetical protein